MSRASLEVTDWAPSWLTVLFSFYLEATKDLIIEKGKYEIVIVQPNVDPYTDKFAVDYEQQLADFIALSKQAKKRRIHERLLILAHVNMGNSTTQTADARLVGKPVVKRCLKNFFAKAQSVNTPDINPLPLSTRIFSA